MILLKLFKRSDGLAADNAVNGAGVVAQRLEVVLDFFGYLLYRGEGLAACDAVCFQSFRLLKRLDRLFGVFSESAVGAAAVKAETVEVHLQLLYIVAL